LLILEWFLPKTEICIAEEFNLLDYQSNPGEFGDHLLKVENGTVRGRKSRRYSIPKK